VTDAQNGKPLKKPPRRGGHALKIDLPFEDAIRAALEIPPENGRKKHQGPPKAPNGQ